MKTVKIKEIEFKKGDTKGLTKTYPSSGLFLIRDEHGISDFVHVNKEFEFVNFICSEEIFNSSFDDELETELPTKKELNISEFNTEKYSGDFILEFARILLNRK